MNPKKIETLLLEGTPFGLRYHDLANWTGRIFVSPRASFKDLLKRDELNKSGVYFFIGQDEETGRLKVYIGEADVLNNRLYGRNSEDFWNEVVVCVSKDESLDKASVRYIESVLVQKALVDKQCDLQNGNTPEIKNLSEANIAVMDEFIDKIIFMLSMLGYKIIRPKVVLQEEKSPLLYCIGPQAKATGRETDEGFIVYKGSTARTKETPSWELGGRNLRKKLIENGVLRAKDKDLLEFTQDYVFNSSSAASGIVLARSSSGPTDWRDKNRKTLKEIHEK